MRLVLDQGVPHDAAALLRDLGREVGMSKAADVEILCGYRVWAAPMWLKWFKGC